MPFTPTSQHFGLDISRHTLRMVAVRSFGRRREIVSSGELPLPDGLLVNGIITNPGAFATIVRRLIDTAHGQRVRTNAVVSVLPESQTFLKSIQLTTEELANPEAALQKAIPLHIPLTMEEIYYDWHVLEPAHPHEPTRVLVAAAPRKVVDSHLAALREAKLVVLALEVEAEALLRSLMSPEEAREGVRLIIDIGAMRTGLVIEHGGLPQLTVSLPISGNAITAAIADRLKLSPNEAEQAKVVCGLDDERCQGALRKILFGTIDELVEKVQEAIGFYRDSFANQEPLKKIIICGGGANFRHIDHVLAERLQATVVVGNPLANIQRFSPKAAIPLDQLQSYVTAIGLALSHDDS